MYAQWELDREDLVEEIRCDSITKLGARGHIGLDGCKQRFYHLVISIAECHAA